MHDDGDMWICVVYFNDEFILIISSNSIIQTTTFLHPKNAYLSAFCDSTFIISLEYMSSSQCH